MGRRNTLALGLLLLTACGGPATVPASQPTPSAAATTAAAAPSATQEASAQTTASPAEAVPAPPANPSGELVLAFAGDSNAFQGGGRSVELGLGDAGRYLASADLAEVNLESALADDATGLKKQPKLYTFLTGRSFPEMLRREGVDVASLANNHAMDYGVPGMERTLGLTGSLAKDLPMFGVGRTTAEAFAPVTLQADGRTVMLLGGNDILESNMDWTPRDGKPGVAMVKIEAQFAQLVDAVRAARTSKPDATVVVVMHWGIDYQVCTTKRQESMASRLADAGADVVVGSHAHRVQRVETIGKTLVAYGLGNFNFYSDRVATRETGVLTVKVPQGSAPTADWAPGTIVDGRPVLLSGAERERAIARWKTLPGGC